MNTPPSHNTLMTFPCDFTIKVFGLATPEFEATVLGIVMKHAPNVADRELKSRSSHHNKYLALSITIRADSQAQLDQIYQDLSASPQVLMAL